MNENLDYKAMWLDLMEELSITLRVMLVVTPSSPRVEVYNSVLLYMLMQNGVNIPAEAENKTPEKVLAIYEQHFAKDAHAPTEHSTSPELKLYVWEEVLCDYTCGVMFALAESVEQAREVILNSGWHGNTEPKDLQGDPKVYTSPVGYMVWGGG